MIIVLAGGTGFIGTALHRHLRDRGDEVRLLVRRAPSGPGEFAWDPDRELLDPAALKSASVVVDLAGSPVSTRWTAANRRRILSSRLRSTRLLAETMALSDDAPAALVQGSAIGYYGNRGEESLPENASVGTGFLAEVVTRWERATLPARDAGCRVALARTGIVLDPGGGALAKMMPLVRAGLAGRLGGGRQWWSWITLADEIRALTFLIDNQVDGPVNLVTPRPTRQIDVVRAMARAVRKPAPLPVPGWALRAVIGGFAGEVLASQKVVPTALTEAGFTWELGGLTEAADAVMDRGKPRESRR